MKVKRKETQLALTAISNIDATIFNVLWPFECMIFKRRHNVHLVKLIEPEIEMISDWRVYELILFNLV